MYKDTEVTYVEKPLPNSSLRVHYYNHNNWITPHIYVYDERGGSAKTLTGQWPGAAMRAEGNEGWWTFDDIDIDEAQVMFNDGIFGQDPEPSHPGYIVNGEVWVKHQKVYFNSKVVVSHIDIEGNKLIEDTVIEGKWKTSEDTYRVTPKSDELGDILDDRGEISGAWSSKVQNIIFIHNPKKKNQDMNNTTSW